MSLRNDSMTWSVATRDVRRTLFEQREARAEDATGRAEVRILVRR